METKINVAEILKDKPQRTILYDYLHNIDVEFDNVEITEIETSIWCTRDKGGYNELFGYSKLGTLRGWLDGLQILLPSKEMRDWSKFAWNKGDVLYSAGLKEYCVFNKFISDGYLMFISNYNVDENTKRVVPKTYDPDKNTVNYEKVSDEKATEIISLIEEHYGGKLNLSTLEIEKQPEFKDGDIVFMREVKSELSANCIFILRGEYNGKGNALYHAFYNADDKFVNAEYGSTRVYYNLRPATYEERQRLFDALAKENKKWDAEKKAIVNLPKKSEFKIFQKVLVRNYNGEEWIPGFFFRIHNDGCRYILVCGEIYKQCIPYNDHTEHLLGTTDEWKGGEG